MCTVVMIVMESRCRSDCPEGCRQAGRFLFLAREWWRSLDNDAAAEGLADMPCSTAVTVSLQEAGTGSWSRDAAIPYVGNFDEAVPGSAALDPPDQLATPYTTGAFAARSLLFGGAERSKWAGCGTALVFRTRQGLQQAEAAPAAASSNSQQPTVPAVASKRLHTSAAPPPPQQ